MSEHEIEIRDELTEFLLYTTPDAGVRVEIFLHDETVWLTQKRLAELFSVKIATINEHLKNIYASGELTESATIRKSLIVQKEGGREVRREVKFYNLDAILSVGYRVNSSQATQFRIWASKILKEYIIKGFAMDDDRLKNGRFFGKDYFREMLERVVSGYFDYIERLLENRTALTMAGLAESVNKFLEFNEYRILDGLGTVSHQVAKNKAESEYDEFNKTQKIESDFDRFAWQIEQDDKEG